MINLNYYNKLVDKILWDIVGNDAIANDDLDDIVNLISQTIRMFDKSMNKRKLKVIIRYLIEQKYTKIYVYNNTTQSDHKLISETPDKVKLSSPDDLVCHRYDYDKQEFHEPNLICKSNRIIEIKQIPQYEQKSKEWLQQRTECLTATAVAIVLDEDPYKFPAELLLDKCNKGLPFEENENVHHGKKYEEIANMYYSFRNNVKVAEYGLLQHDEHAYIGASPDGICEKYTMNETSLTKLVGRLLEIKCPFRRKICVEGKLDGDICPHYYYVQVQTQLFVTKMDECDFLQCEIGEYSSFDEFVNDSDTHIPSISKTTNLEKGCLIQLLPKDMITGDPKMCLYNAKYLYPPKLHMTIDEIKLWISSEFINFPQNDLSHTYVIDRVIYWRLTKTSCNLIRYDAEWFKSKIPILKQFWDYIEYYRANPDKLQQLCEYIVDVGFMNSALVFSRIHKDYSQDHPSTQYHALYQTENEWRKKYYAKYSYLYRKSDFKNKWDFLIKPK